MKCHVAYQIQKLYPSSWIGTLITGEKKDIMKIKIKTNETEKIYKKWG